MKIALSDQVREVDGTLVNSAGKIHSIKRIMKKHFSNTCAKVGFAHIITYSSCNLCLFDETEATPRLISICVGE